MGFDDLVNEKLAAQRDSASAQDQRASSLAAARAAFELAITTIGRSAAQTLISHGVAPEPTGRIRKRWFEAEGHVVETGGAWPLHKDLSLYLLPDGRSCVLHGLRTGWTYASNRNGQSILDDTPGFWLSEVLTDVDSDTMARGCREASAWVDIYAWLIDGVPMVARHGDGDRVPFEDWAAEAVAHLIRA